MAGEIVLLQVQMEEDRNEVESIPNEPNPNPERYVTYEQMNLINSFRFFMLDMAIYSRFVASCMLLYKGCFDVVFARLLQVPYDSYQQMSAYLGRERADKYYNLINQHIIIMVELIQALQAGDQKEADVLLAKWYRNAEESAAYLASINPYWTEEQWRSLFYKYVQLLLNQILTTQTNNFQETVAVFDELRYHSILIGDTLATGIMQLLNIQPPQVVVPPGTVTVPEQSIQLEPVRPPAGPVPSTRNFR